MPSTLYFLIKTLEYFQNISYVYDQNALFYVSQFHIKKAVAKKMK